jgi:hypothetical protein
MRVRSALLVVLVGLEACIHGQARDAKCEWPAKTGSAIGKSTKTNQRQLTRDALKAEDLAIRYADSRNAPHSGHFKGFPAYARTTDSCKTALFAAVAHNHGVSSQEVRSSLDRRPLPLDLAVMLSFAAFYGLVAYRVASRVCGGFPLDGGSDTVAAVTATVLASLAVSGLAVLIGEWYALTAEMAWIGNGHLSYRVDRIPWVHHRLELFLTGVLFFVVIAALRYRPSFVRSSPAPRN